MYGTAPQIGIWFNSDALVEVLRWVAFSFILSSIALVPRSLLVRHMDFKRLFTAAMIAMVIGNLGIGLGLAYAGFGVWAYVAGPAQPECGLRPLLLVDEAHKARKACGAAGSGLTFVRCWRMAGVQPFSIGSTMPPPRPTRCSWENSPRPTPHWRRLDRDRAV